MKKRVLILSSSPRRNGNSDALCDAFLKGAEEAGNAAEKIFLADKKINYCLGCGACSERGLPCPQKDDADGIAEKMIGADVIVMATPVYFYSVSAQLKTLIDRMCARYTEISGKEFYFIMTAADTDPACMEYTLGCFRGFTDCLDGAEEKGVIRAVGLWKKGEAQKSAFYAAAYEMGKNV